MGPSWVLKAIPLGDTPKVRGVLSGDDFTWRRQVYNPDRVGFGFPRLAAYCRVTGVRRRFVECVAGLRQVLIASFRHGTQSQAAGRTQRNKLTVYVNEVTLYARSFDPVDGVTISQNGDIMVMRLCM